jgi:hypothetical protein
LLKPKKLKSEDISPAVFLLMLKAADARPAKVKESKK